MQRFNESHSIGITSHIDLHKQLDLTQFDNTHYPWGWIIQQKCSHTDNLTNKKYIDIKANYF